MGYLKVDFTEFLSKKIERRLSLHDVKKTRKLSIEKYYVKTTTAQLFSRNYCQKGVHVSRYKNFCNFYTQNSIKCFHEKSFLHILVIRGRERKTIIFPYRERILLTKPFFFPVGRGFYSFSL